MKKHILNFRYIILLLSLVCFSCSNDDESDIEIKKPDATIKLVANKTEIQPFEDIKVSIDVDEELLLQNYDSIQWIANGTAYYGFWIGNLSWTKDDGRDIRITDYRLSGKHKVYALGYKNGNVVSKDSISYEIKKNYGDFVTIRWGESKTNRYFYYTIGHTPRSYYLNKAGFEEYGGVCLNLSHHVEEKTEYATLEFTRWMVSGSSLKSAKESAIPNINNFDWLAPQDHREDSNLFELMYQTQYDFHHNYISELYGKPKFIYEGDDVTKTTLWDEYNKRFTYTPDSSWYPEQIWETATSYICMVRANNSGAVNQKGIIKIVAEPRIK